VGDRETKREETREMREMREKNLKLQL